MALVGLENEIILALGKPGKQKTKFLSTENLNQINEVDENWSISNALGLYSENQSRFFIFGGYNDATGTLFEKTLELDKGQLISECLFDFLHFPRNQ